MKPMRPEEITKNVATNLVELRKKRGLTQLDVADHFNYSDKSISKWERGEALPDLITLQEIADFYGVTIDYLTHEPTEDNAALYAKSREKIEYRNRIIICCLWILGVLTIASVACGGIILISSDAALRPWMPFVWAIPGIFLVLAIYAWRYKKRVHGLAYQICFVWGLLTSIYLEIGLNISDNEGWNLIFLFIIGIPLTFILVLKERFSK